MKLIRLLPIVLLAGCASGAIIVEETANRCSVSGALFTPSVLEQVPPESSAEYTFDYHGDNCIVRVWSDGTVAIEEK